MRRTALLGLTAVGFGVASAWSLLALPVEGQREATQRESPLRFKFKKDEKFSYGVEAKMRMLTSTAGKDVDMEITVDQDVHWHILSVADNGSARAAVKYGRAKMLFALPGLKVAFDSADATPPANPAMKDLHTMVQNFPRVEMVCTVSVHGEVQQLKVNTDALRKIQGLEGMHLMQGMLREEALAKSLLGNVVLPAGPVPRGHQWSQKIEMPMPPIGVVVGELRYQYQGTATKNGREVDVLTMTPQLAMRTDPKSGLEVKTKTMDGRGYAFFDGAAGRLVELSNSQRIEIETKSGPMLVNQHLSTSTLMRLKQPAGPAGGVQSSEPRSRERTPR